MFTTRKKHEEFLSGLKRHKLAVKQEKSENVVLILGDTGVGKSTLINYMLGLELFAHKLDNSYALVIDCQVPSLAPIGHEKVSTTSTPVPYKPYNNDYTFWDCPGFEDTGGKDFAIINAYSISQLSKLAKNFKFLAVIEERSLKEPARGVALTDLLSKLSNMLKTYDFTSFTESFLFCFTKANGAILDHQAFLYDLITQIREEGISLDESLKSFLKLIADKKQFIVFNQPTEEGIVHLDIKDKIQNKLSSTKFLQSPDLSPAVSTEAAMYFEKTLIKYFQSKVEYMMLDIIEKIHTELEKEQYEQFQDFAFNKFLLAYKACYRETKDSIIITELEKLLSLFKDQSLLTDLSDIKFIITEVFEFLSDRILKKSKVEGECINKVFDNIGKFIEEHFKSLQMIDEAELFHNEVTKIPTVEIVDSSCNPCCNIYALTKIIYDNPILNYPNILKIVSKNLGINISEVIDITTTLDKEFLHEVCEIGNVDLLQECFY